MSQYTFLVTFDNAPPADAARYANELREFILDAAPDVTVQRQRSDSYAQDFGTTLVLVLGTPAVVAVVTAISNWIKMRHSASLTLETPEGKFTLTSTDEIVERLGERLTNLLLAKKSGEQ
jgi:hypothetical protein